MSYNLQCRLCTYSGFTFSFNIFTDYISENYYESKTKQFESNNIVNIIKWYLLSIISLYMENK